MKLVIVGAGFAGIATAYHLARRGVREILVVEREEGPGVHASGKNAGLLRQSSHDPALVPLLRAGARAAKRILAGIPGALRPCGSLILGAGVSRLRGGSRARILPAADIVPGLKGKALYDPEDAIADPHALLQAMLTGARRRGVTFAFGEEIVQVRIRGGAVAAVRTTERMMAVDAVVVAAGAWTGAVAALAGSTAVEILPRRRHLFRGHLQSAEGADWPFVWHEDEGVYFRPEGDGFLLSPCDVEPHPPSVPLVDPNQREALAAKVHHVFDALGEWSVGSGWACLRTFAPDERFVIGHDPAIGGLFWVAGLGGHGMTAAWSVGRLAARVFLKECDAGPFDPSRVLAIRSRD